MTQEIEQIVTKHINDLREEIKEELAKMKKELLSEIAYNNRNLEKKIEGFDPSAKESKKENDYDLDSSTSFQWVKDHLSDLDFQQIVAFFKQIIQSSNVKCDPVNTNEFGRDKNSFYQILDSVWDQLSSYLGNSSGDIYKTALNGVASLLSSFGSK